MFHSSYVISIVTTKRVVVTMLVLAAAHQGIWNTRLIGRSLLLRSLAQQKFIQVCKVVKQASHLVGASAWRDLVDRTPAHPSFTATKRTGELLGRPRIRRNHVCTRSDVASATCVSAHCQLSSHDLGCKMIRIQPRRTHDGRQG